MLGYKTNRIFAMSSDKFCGVDLSEVNKNLLSSSSAMSENLFVNAKGALEKRTGVKSVYCAQNGNVHGIYKYTSGEDTKEFYIVHEGEKLFVLSEADGGFEKESLLYEGISDCESKGFLFGGALYIMCDGYYKISYVEAFKALGICRVCDYHKDEDEESADVIVEQRSKQLLDGNYLGVIDDKKRYAKIKFKEDTYCFQYSNGTYDKLYIAPKGYIDAVRVIKLKMGDDVIDSFHYSVEEDEKGMYVKLSRRNIYVSKNYACAAEVLIEIGGFVYAPLNIASRLAIGMDSNKKVISEHEEREKFTGEYVQDLNLACGLRRVNFYINFDDFSNASEIRFYLNEKSTYGSVMFIRVGGKLIQDYTEQEGENSYVWRVDDFYDYYVDINKSFLKSFTEANEVVVEIEYITRQDSEIDGCDIYGFYGGANDTRVFVAGNKSKIACDYASGAFDGSYFPALEYVTVGDDYSQVLGYGRFFSYQLIFKDENGGSAMYFRHLSDDNTYVIKKGELLRGAVSKNAVANVNSHLFILTREGIFSIESTQIEGQTKCVLRSKEISGLLEQSKKIRLEAYDGKLLAIADKHVFVLDIEGGYKWFVYSFEKPIEAMYMAGERYFVCGKYVLSKKSVCDKDAYEDYYAEDEKYAVSAYWKTNNVCFSPFEPRDILSAYAVTGDESFVSSLKIIYSGDDFGEREATEKNTDVFTFEKIDFSRFSFVGKNKGRSVKTHIKAKRVHRFSLTFKNDKSEPFELCEIGFLYR